MNSYLQIFLALILTGLAVFAGHILSALPPWPVVFYYLAFAAMGLGVLVVPFVQDMMSHNEWLRKRKLQSHRDTEVLIPPKGMLEAHKIFQDSGKEQEEKLQAFADAYRAKAIRRTAGVLALVLLIFLSFFLTQLTNIINALNDLIHLSGQEIDLGLFSTQKSLLPAFLAALLLVWSVDAMRRLNGRVISQIRQSNDAPSLARQYAMTFLMIILGGLFYGGFYAYDTYSQQQQASQRKVQKIEQKAEALAGEQQALAVKKDFLAKENAALNKEIMEKKHALKGLRKEKTQLEGKIQSHEEHINSLKSKLKQAQSELAALKKDHAANTEKLRTEAEALREDLTQKQTELKKVKAERDEIRERLGLTQGALETTKQDLHDTKSKLQNWQTPISLAQTNWGDLAEVVKNGTRLRLPSALLFRQAQQDKLNTQTSDKLAAIAEGLGQLLDDNPDAWVVVMAHANALPPQTGGYENKLALTALQAVRVKEVLNEKGIQPILAAGFGHQRELDSRLIAEALKKNNRIEIAVIRMPL